MFPPTTKTADGISSAVLTKTKRCLLRHVTFFKDPRSILREIFEIFSAPRRAFEATHPISIYTRPIHRRKYCARGAQYLTLRQNIPSSFSTKMFPNLPAHAFRHRGAKHASSSFQDSFSAMVYLFSVVLPHSLLLLL